ncbi:MULTISPECIES: hypothetical protein [Gracilibacillus]|uniref:hypothetical protein n=1 Tax=Gracilibacillus TaxID=74385 RepID=UPI000AD1316B|nr:MULTISPECIES: hypothetical protein [Gracilibacillus]
MNPILIILIVISMVLLAIVSHKGCNQQKELTRKGFYGIVAVMVINVYRDGSGYAK